MFDSNKLLQIGIIVIGLIGAGWFLIPFLLHKILNIGNGTGFLFFLCVVLYGMYMRSINHFIINLFQSVVGKVLVTIVGLIFAISLIIVIALSACIIQAANQKPRGNNPTVIILGCRVYGEKPSLMLTERLDAAYEYLITNEGIVCILSGGQGKGEDISEAECMYRYLVNKGIEPKRLYKEEKSTSTRENLAFSKELIKEYNLSRDIAIVTNEFHEYRARKIATALDLSSTAIKGKTAWWLFPTFYVRELYGIIYEMFL